MKKSIPIPVRIILLLTFFLGSLALFTYRAYLTKKDKMKEATSVKIAVTISPLDFRVDSAGQISGLQYALGNILLKDTTISWIPTTSREEAMKKLEDGDVDIYASSYPLTSQRHIEGIIPTKELYVSGFALVQRQDSITGDDWKKQLQGDGQVKIYIPKGSRSAKMMLENLREFSCPAIEIVEADKSVEDLCMEVQAGTIDYAFCDRNIVTKLSDHLDRLNIVRDVAFDVYQVWLVNANKTDLLTRLNDSIQALSQSKPFVEVLESYGLQ